MMQKIKVKITGRKVHDVGYRVLLVNKVLSLGVDNFNTFNTYFDGVQAVVVVIETDEEVMEEFKSFVVSTRPEKSIVDDISFEEYRNSVPPVERVMQSFQMEQWGKGIPILLHISDTLDTHTSILEKNTSVLEKNTSVLKDFKKESNENFSDLKSIVSKHDIDAGERFSSIQMEISEIKERLSNVESVVSAV
ncbi:MAG: acylphosphatase [ANME-2 cluster archaeon]|jgi:acylphosphatase|nr:acylphosphatase [ANME-2 cluster archaeon]